MNKQVNVLNHIVTVLQQKLPIKEIITSDVDGNYVLSIYSNDGVQLLHYINKYDLEYLERDIEIYYYTKVVLHTVSKLLENA